VEENKDGGVTVWLM